MMMFRIDRIYWQTVHWETSKPDVDSILNASGRDSIPNMLHNVQTAGHKSKYISSMTGEYWNSIAHQSVRKENANKHYADARMQSETNECSRGDQRNIKTKHNSFGNMIHFFAEGGIGGGGGAGIQRDSAKS